MKAINLKYCCLRKLKLKHINDPFHDEGLPCAIHSKQNSSHPQVMIVSNVSSFDKPSLFKTIHLVVITLKIN